jgi:hypothetical protein
VTSWLSITQLLLEHESIVSAFPYREPRTPVPPNARFSKRFLSSSGDVQNLDLIAISKRRMGPFRTQESDPVVLHQDGLTNQLEIIYEYLNSFSHNILAVAI